MRRVARAGWAGALLAGACTVTAARAQLAPGGGGDAPLVRKQARAVRLTDAAPRLDGRLDDGAWELAEPITDFVQKEPVEGAEPTERTEVRLLYDDAFLYVGARMYARDPAAIQRSVARRDVGGGQSEHIWISLDTYLDRRTAYSFGVTAAGGRIDWYHPRDHEYAIDTSFDPVWEARAVLDSLGWTAEMRIPFSQLRFSRADEQVWGLNIDRWVPSRFEDIFWIPVPRNVTAWSSRMGELHGIRGIRPSRRVELMPYVASNATVASAHDPRNPFDPDGRTGELRAGGDVKMGLGPNLTLQGTVNPDFGQVEADPAVVNLSAFEVFFEERRPFFTEGSRLLTGNGPAYFYSRRIGAAPPGPAGGDFVRRPSATTILGAAKLTGRTASGLSVGALAAVAGREYARSHDLASGTSADTLIAPATGFAVARLQQEFGASRSVIGAMVTAVERDHTPGSVLDGLHGRRAFSGGVDWNLRWNRGADEFGGWLGGSHVEGSAAAVDRLQRSPRRYLQRPDQAYARYDPAATSLNGWSAGLSAVRNSGRHWLWNVNAAAESPGLELNDAGRISTADGLTASGTIHYRETVPGRWFRSSDLALNLVGEWNFGYTRQFSTTRLDWNATWKNQMSHTVTAWVDHRAQDERLTRGGPSMGTPISWVTIAQVRSSFAANTQWNARVYYGRTEIGGLTYRLSGGVTLRPGPRWLLSASPNYLFLRDARQYVASVPDSIAVATFGARYVFAFVDDNEWSVPLRFNYAFTPDLTLELYLQPFIASGRFFRHGELARAGDDAVREYGVAPGTAVARDSAGNYVVTDGGRSFGVPFRDFSQASIRGNLVLRWEWRRGSTLFLVWQQRRGEEAARGARVRVGDLFDGFEAAGDNFFAIKASYWIGGR